MTKVQLQYRLAKPLGDDLLDRIARAHGIYGILRLTMAPELDGIIVEYDASRLSPLEVETALHQMGIPVVVDV